MASRNNLPPPHFCPPRLRSIRGAGGSSAPRDVDLEATSINVDEYLAGLHDGQRGDDGEDLSAANLFGAKARNANDGGDRMAMLTPSSNASSMAAGTPSSTHTIRKMHSFVGAGVHILN
jgi:hypothetical protein